MKWKTQNGDILEPKDMTISHINNCIRQLNMRISQLDFEYDGMVEYGYGYSQYCIREEIDHLKSVIKEFDKELSKR